MPPTLATVTQSTTRMPLPAPTNCTATSSQTRPIASRSPAGTAAVDASSARAGANGAR